MLAMASTDIIFVKDRTDAEIQLRKKYPGSHPLLDRIEPGWKSGSYEYRNNDAILRDGDTVEIYDISDERLVCGTGSGDLAQLIELVNKLTEVSLDDRGLGYRDMDTGHDFREKLRDAGIAVKKGLTKWRATKQQKWHRLRWNPKGVRGSVKAADTRAANYKKKHPTKTGWLSHACGGMKDRIGARFEASMFGYCGDDTDTQSLIQLERVLRRHNTLFGHNAHRSVKAFHTLVKEWPDCLWRQVLYDEIALKLSADGSDKKHLRNARRILKWLDNECKQKMQRTKAKPVMKLKLWKLPPLRKTNGKARTKARKKAKSRR